jgi:hypothetical protein
MQRAGIIGPVWIDRELQCAALVSGYLKDYIKADIKVPI